MTSEVNVDPHAEHLGPGPGADDQQLMDAATLLRRAVLRLGRRLQAERGPGGLTLLKLSVLGNLNRYGVMTPGQLASLERYQPQSLTRVLGALEADGLISREPNIADGRQALLQLTEQGGQVLADEMIKRDRWLATTVAANLSPLERGVLELATHLIDRIAEVGDVNALAAPSAKRPQEP
jgi:DNA-binding MarR family transcriptional regulator